MWKEEMGGKGDEPRFKEVHLTRGGSDTEVKRVTCLTLKSAHLLPRVIHVTALRGRYYQPHFTGDLTEDMVVLVLFSKGGSLP